MTDDDVAVVLRATGTAATAQEVLDRLAQHVVRSLADWCIVDGVEPPDLLTRQVALGRDGPLDVPEDLGPVGARRSAADSAGMLAALAQHPARPLRLDAEALARMAGSDDPRLRSQSALAVRLGVVDLLLFGLHSADQLHGVLAVGRGAGAFAAQEVEVLADLARLTGLVLERLRLLEVQRGVAAALQRTLLPRLPRLEGLTLAARFVPATESLSVGGDWYDSFVLPSGAVALTVGDATGHDVRAAVRMAELRNLLRALVVDGPVPPARTLCRLDRVLDAVAPQLSGTCVLAHLDRDRRLHWSSAGHLPPVLLRAGRARLLEEGQPDLMLGVEAETERTDHEQQLEAGDVLLLYTDGLVEARSAGLDARLRELVTAVEALAAAGPEALADRLVERLASGEDDVALLVVRVDA